MARTLSESQRDEVTKAFSEELSDWRNRNHGWTRSQQLMVFGASRLWHRSKGDQELYERLMRIAGYQITKEDLAAKT